MGLSKECVASCWAQSPGEYNDGKPQLLQLLGPEHTRATAETQKEIFFGKNADYPH